MNKPDLPGFPSRVWDAGETPFQALTPHVDARREFRGASKGGDEGGPTCRMHKEDSQVFILHSILHSAFGSDFCILVRFRFAHPEVQFLCASSGSITHSRVSSRPRPARRASPRASSIRAPDARASTISTVSSGSRWSMCKAIPPEDTSRTAANASFASPSRRMRAVRLLSAGRRPPIDSRPRIGQRLGLRHHGMFDPPLALPLGPVHKGVHPLDHQIHVGQRPEKRHGADAQRNRPSLPPHLPRQLFLQPCQQGRRTFRPRLRQQQREARRPPGREQVRVAQVQLDRLHHAPQPSSPTAWPSRSFSCLKLSRSK